MHKARGLTEEHTDAQRKHKVLIDFLVSLDWFAIGIRSIVNIKLIKHK